MMGQDLVLYTQDSMLLKQLPSTHRGERIHYSAWIHVENEGISFSHNLMRDYALNAEGFEPLEFGWPIQLDFPTSDDHSVLSR